MADLAEMRRTAWQAIKPPPRLDLAEWAEATIRIPSVAAQPGPMRLFPYQVEIARSMGAPGVERVSVKKAARVGMTQLAVAAIANYVVNDPAAQLVVMPSDADCLMLVKSIMDPTFAASPALRDVFARTATGVDTLRERFYSGGSLSIVSGGSAKALRARSARCLWIDEVDALSESVAEDGDPVALAIRRTATFGTSRKIVLLSTPLDEATSRIARAFEDGDQRRWLCPCPHCATAQEVAWRDVRWPEGQPEAAYWACPTCGGVVEEGPDKVAFVSAGQWVATYPERADHHSYHLTALISGLATAKWGELAKEFVAAKNDPHLLKTFINLTLAEVWRERGQGVDESALTLAPIGLDRIPDGALYVTGGVDVQSGASGRLELSTVAWDADGRGYVLGHETIWGDPLGREVWLALSDMLARRFGHPRGGTIGYDRTLIDSGDGNTVAAVYAFARGRAPGVFASKGVGGWREPPIALGRAADKSVRLQLLGVDPLKDRVHRMASGGSLIFSDALPPSYFEQLAGEEVRVKYQRGFATRAWHQLAGRRSEALDCAAMAIAAKHLLSWNPDRRAEEVSSAGAISTPPTVIHSRWLNR